MSARSEVVIFDNCGSMPQCPDQGFVWVPYCNTQCPQPGGTYLDVTQSSAQNGLNTPTTFGLEQESPSGIPNWYWFAIANIYNPASTMRVVADDEPIGLLGDAEVVQYFDFARELAPGDVVDSTSNLIDTAFVWVYNAGNPTPEVEAGIDLPAYIGVSFETAAGETHYGWILIDEDTFYYQPRLWAYETEPDTAIAIDPCPADFDGDGGVGINDFLAVLMEWGPCPGCPQDLDGDGTVGMSDFLAVLAAWGPCPLN